MRLCARIVRRYSVFILLCILLSTRSKADTYVAVASGAWTAATTWNRPAPSRQNNGDTVVIPTGLTITLTSNATLDGPLAVLNVLGTLTIGQGSTLTLRNGTLKGAGSLRGGVFVVDLQGGAPFVLPELTRIASTIELRSGDLDLRDLTANIYGGVTGVGKVLVNDSTVLNVNTGNREYGLLKLSGSIGTLRIRIEGDATVGLGSDILITKLLDLQSGILDLNGSDIVVSGDVRDGDGRVVSTASSNITFDRPQGTDGTLKIFGEIDTLKVNHMAGKQSRIEGEFTVLSLLDLKSGSVFADNLRMTLTGDVRGVGSLLGSIESHLIVNRKQGLSAPLVFPRDYFNSEMGAFGSLVIDINDDAVVEIEGNLHIDNKLDVMAGTLAMDETVLVLNGLNVVAGRTGRLSTTANTEIRIPSHAKVDLRFGPNDTVGILSFATGQSGHPGSENPGEFSLLSDLCITTEIRLGDANVSIGDHTLRFGTGVEWRDESYGTYLSLGRHGRLQYDSMTAPSFTKSFGTAGGHRELYVHWIDERTNIFESNPGAWTIQASDDVRAGGDKGEVLSTTLPMVAATWFISTETNPGIVTLMYISWDAKSEVNGFDRTKAVLMQFKNGAWIVAGKDHKVHYGNASDYQMEITDVEELGTFAIFDRRITDVVSEHPQRAVALFPNPATHSISLELPEAVSSAVVQILDVAGHVVLSTVIEGGSALVNIDSLSAGVYTVRVDDGRSIQTVLLTKIY